MTPEVDGWVHGWAAARGVAPPVAVTNGWLLTSDREREAERRVLRSTDGLAEAVAAASRFPSWIKLPAAGEPPVLRGGWALRAVDHLMVLSGPAGPAGLPDGYRLEQRVEGARGVAEVRRGDELAARGVVGLAGGVAVPDQVVTEEAHRRRGLGRCVMAALEEIAAGAGATTSVLVATDDGRALYEPMGWRTLAAFPAYRLLGRGA